MEHGQSNAESSPANMSAGQIAARMGAAEGDYAQQVATFQDCIRRMGVAGWLDIGSATVYFAFEFEKRGAEVVSVDLLISHHDRLSVPTIDEDSPL